MPLKLECATEIDRFAPHPSESVENCPCAKDRLIVLDALAVFRKDKKTGLVIARCSECNRHWAVWSAIGLKIPLLTLGKDRDHALD